MVSKYLLKALIPECSVLRVRHVHCTSKSSHTVRGDWKGVGDAGTGRG